MFDDRGHLLCVDRAIVSVPAPLLHLNRVDGHQVGNQFLWIIPVHAASGRVSRYVWIQPPLTHGEPPRRWALVPFAFPQLPVAIAVGGLTTFVLVLLITRPIVRSAKPLALSRRATSIHASSSPHPTHSSSTGGFGVGLAISERAVRLHGGTLQPPIRPPGAPSSASSSRPPPDSQPPSGAENRAVTRPLPIS